MKKRRWLWAVILAGVILLAVLIAVCVLTLSEQQETKKYYAQLRSARQYLTEGDYDTVVSAYETAISLRPDDPDGYIELATYQEEQGEYSDALATAQQGYTITRDETLEAMVQELLAKLVEISIGETEAETTAVVTETREDTAGLMLRTPSLSVLADACYYELVQEYGDATVTYLSSEEGYRVKFARLNAYAYYKNTDAYPNQIDTIRRVPADAALPYQYEILSPSILFVSYDGYISYAKLIDMFQVEEAAVSYEEAAQQYYVTVDCDGYTLKLASDAAGNISGESPEIWLIPDEDRLFKEDFTIEEETEESTEDPNTFTLGSYTFTYDVTSIYIYGETITDLSPLANCKDLVDLELRNCVLGSLDPLAGCESLEYLYLNASTGFSDISALSGLTNLKVVNLHSAADVEDISPIMEKELELLHTCNTKVTYEQTVEYLLLHPDCEVWYANHILYLSDVTD